MTNYKEVIVDVEYRDVYINAIKNLCAYIRRRLEKEYQDYTVHVSQRDCVYVTPEPKAGEININNSAERFNTPEINARIKVIVQDAALKYGFKLIS